jgi:hypothetical protein
LELNPNQNGAGQTFPMQIQGMPSALHATHKPPVLGHIAFWGDQEVVAQIFCLAFTETDQMPWKKPSFAVLVVLKK